MSDILSVRKVGIRYPVRKQNPLEKQKFFTAVHSVSFSITQNTAYALIGESGSGKTTVGNAILGFLPIFRGEILYQNSPIENFHFKGNIQAVFQNPYNSLNPRSNILEIVSEPYRNLHPKCSKEKLESLTIESLHAVGMSADARFRYPHQFSGGQRQRISIARALISSPSLIVLDEPVSSLDVSIRAQILNLLSELKEKKSLSYLFISHDLATVRYLAQRTGIIYRGHLLEQGLTHEIFQNPANPYTEMLLKSAREILSDFQTANREETTVGCPFYSRCPKATLICKEQFPQAQKIGEDHEVSCHHL